MGMGVKQPTATVARKKRMDIYLQLQPAAALRKHDRCAHPQFFELIESHHAFTPHKLINHPFSFPKTINVGNCCIRTVISQRSM
jgi:hypothetical protein